MTYEEAAKILDPETSREALLPYAYDPQYQQMLLRKACVIAANVLESYAALTVSCPEGDLIMPGGETFKAKFLSLPRVSYEPLRPVDVMPVNCIKIQYNGEKKFPTIEEFAREAKDQAIKIIEEETGVSFDRLVQLAYADQEGRCVVLPVKVGDFVYSIKYSNVIDKEFVCKAVNIMGENSSTLYETIDEKGLCSSFFGRDIGKTVFLTEEQAESTLEKIKEREDNETD